MHIKKPMSCVSSENLKYIVISILLEAIVKLLVHREIK